MKNGEDVPRWLESAEDAPPQFEALVHADEASDFDAERLARVADGLASQLNRPALGSALRAQLQAPAGNSAGKSLALAGKLAAGLSVLAATAWLGLRVPEDTPEPEPASIPAPAPPANAAPLPDPAAPVQAGPAPAPPPNAVPLPDSAPAAPARAAPARVETAAPKPLPEVAPRRVPRQAAPAQAVVPDPGAELALLTRAQRALRDDPRAALSLARQHRRRFDRGQFVQEREMIAIEALLQLGERPVAERRGARFLRDHPGSSHAPRLRQLLGEETR